MMGPPFAPFGPARTVPFFRGLRARIAATVGLLVGGLCWILLYLAFLASRFSWFQNLAVVLTTVLLVPAVVLVMWVLWGISVGRRFRRAYWDAPFP